MTGAVHDLATALAARRYLACRLNLHGAEGADLLARLYELDSAYHDLVRACGLACVDVGCEHGDDDYGSDEVTRPIQDVLPGL